MFVEILEKENASSVLVGILAAVFVTTLFYLRKVQRYPPGPYGIPFFGYLPLMTKNPHVKLMELSKKYGPVFSLSIGTETVVMLCDYVSIKKAFNQVVTMGRPPGSIFNLQEETIETGAITHVGWKDQRRHALHTLRDLGFGKSRMEADVREEIEELLDRFEKENGQPIVPTPYLTPSTSNNVASFIFGKRRKFDDPKRMLLDQLLNDSRNLVNICISLVFFPRLRTLCRKFNIGAQGHLQNVEVDLQNFLKEEIKEHKETLEAENIRDFIDGFLVEMKKNEDNPLTTYKEPVLEDLVNLFFGAGSETIRAVVDWLILISAAFPEVQKRVQSEIDSAIGSERFPSRVDYLKMPYTEAVILEMYRWRGALPINLPRYTLEDTEIDSHFIPKNTQVIALFWAINQSPELWGDDVTEFKPTRFLSANEEQIRKPDFFSPFSSGKRACPGEALANVTVFMYYTAILQKFNLRLEEGVKPDFEGELFLRLQPKPQKICFELRK